MQRALAGVLLLLATELAVLIITGVLLFLYYRPSASSSFSEPGFGGQGTKMGFPDLVRLVHRVDSAMSVLTTVAGAILVLLSSARTRKRWTPAAMGLGMVGAALAASLTGLLLPWDELALWSVTVGTDLRGFRPLFHNQVRFVLIDSSEVSRETVVGWLIVHATLGVSLLVLAALAWRIGRRRETPIRS